jgi:hypothetical protein
MAKTNGTGSTNDEVLPIGLFEEVAQAELEPLREENRPMIGESGKAGY